MKKLYLVLIVLFLKPNFVSAQQNDLKHCGTDEINIELLQQYPTLLNNWIKKYYEQEQFINEYQFESDGERSGDTVFKIPVVVHVIHFDGIENISDAQIKNGIDILTRNYRKQNPDTVDIVPFFQEIFF